MSDSEDSADSEVADALTGVGFSAQWERVDAPADCMCADGSAWSYFVRDSSETKVMFFLEGGGACFTAQMCAKGSDTYKQVVGQEGGFAETEGVFDLDNPKNPFADYSIVFVPYCTGDVHGGSVTKDYGDGVVVQHKGFVNGSTAMTALLERFPDATEVVVAGVSAGSFPTPAYAGLIADSLPNASVRVIADGSGAIPDAMGAVSSNWGLLEALPQWPEIAGATAADVTPSWIFEIAAKHDPEIRFARHDYAFDATLADYAAMVGIAASDLLPLMEANEAKVEAFSGDMSTWIAPGDNHTILSKADMYSEELGGVRFIDWLSDFVAGGSPADQHCTQCS